MRPSRGIPWPASQQPAVVPGLVQGPAASQEPGTREWLAKQGARPSPTSAAPFPSGNGLILQRSTTLLLAQAAQIGVHDSARQPESFGHRYMDMAPPFAALSFSRSCRIASA
jgi:hypothetical protein